MRPPLVSTATGAKLRSSRAQTVCCSPPLLIPQGKERNGKKQFRKITPIIHQLSRLTDLRLTVRRVKWITVGIHQLT